MCSTLTTIVRQKTRRAMTLVEKTYFRWVYSNVEGTSSYLSLCRYLNGAKFDWVIPNDQNRIADAIREREIFADTVNHGLLARDVDHLMNLPVSIFEVLSEMAKQIDFQMDDMVSPPRANEWFAILLKNLELDSLTDSRFSNGRRIKEEIDEKLSIFINRTYDDYGRGSLFPLYPDFVRNYREIELWYQMMMWLAKF